MADETSGKSELSEGRLRSLANLRPFQPGQSGNPSGRPKKRPITEIYEQLLAENPEMVREQLKALMTGRSAMAKVMFLREAAERLEGKVAQPVELNGEIALTLADRMTRAEDRLRDEEVNKPE